MNATEEYWLRILLELRMRQNSGDAFQDFFGRIMEARYGADYVRIRPFGQRGDKGCDGYLSSCGRVFQCYGAVNGDGSKVDYLVGKLAEDFEKAKKHLGDIMKEWHLAHNLVDGLPIEAVQALNSLKAANAALSLGFVARESLAVTLSEIEPSLRDTLVGPLATAADEQNLEAVELKNLVCAILQAVDDAAPTPVEIKPVSAVKLAHNQLPPHWVQFLSAGWQNAHHVSNYFSKHADPMAGDRVAQRFRERYEYLRSQNLTPADILAELYEFVVGVGNVPIPKLIAAQALLAHLFESCDILEDVPETAAS